MAGGGIDEECTLLLATDIISAPPAAEDSTLAPLAATKPKRTRKVERAWLLPYVVLVINDNLYGLMCALSYICSVGP